MKKSTICLLTISIFLISLTSVKINHSVERNSAYSATRVTLKNFNSIKLGGSPGQVLKIFGKPHGEGSSGMSRSISYYQKFKKKMVEVTIQIQKVKGKDMITGKTWRENLR
jgi:outer membrane protein assembly factor BamE (lipoprotein component of BamABCDE complex)